MVMMMAVVAVDAVRPVDNPTEGEAEDDAHDDPYDPPGYLGHLLPKSYPSWVLESWESASNLGSR